MLILIIIIFLFLFLFLSLFLNVFLFLFPISHGALWTAFVTRRIVNAPCHTAYTEHSVSHGACKATAHVGQRLMSDSGAYRTTRIHVTSFLRSARVSSPRFGKARAMRSIYCPRVCCRTWYCVCNRALAHEYLPISTWAAGFPRLRVPSMTEFRLRENFRALRLLPST